MKKTKSVLCLAMVFLFVFTSIAAAQESGIVLNRLDFTKQVLEACGIQPVSEVNFLFKDIPDEADAAYVEAAYRNKIVSGYQNYFYPQKPITKEEAITILVNALGEKGIANRIGIETADTALSFQDKDAVSNWAKPYVVYAVRKGMISGEEGILDPLKKVTKDEADQMLQVAEGIFLREGLPAYEMLQKVEQNLNVFDSYKFKGKAKMEMSVVGVPEESVHMEIIQEGVFAKPQKVYVKSVAAGVGGNLQELEEQEESEVFLDDGTMYVKSGKEGKWLKIDTNPLMQQIEKIMGNQISTNGLLSQEQMELFGMYASYDADATLDDKDYYVLNIDLDYHAFKQIYQELLERMGGYLESIVQSKAEDAGIPVDMQEVKKVISDLIQKIDIEAKYKYYIDKQTKQYHTMQMNQNMRMEVEGTTVQTKLQGEYTYYDFNEEVDFPQIDPQDTQTVSDLFSSGIAE
ncbi:MAG TPA: S-layer homology domain-containing protein [Clostridiales bacterium]|nr:S-layer homology domain-containing protein [Clostridiales bacterium]